MKHDPEIIKLQNERAQIESLLNVQNRKLYSKFEDKIEKLFWQDREERLFKVVSRAIIPACIFYFLFMCISLSINYMIADPVHRAHDISRNIIAFMVTWVALLSVFFMVKRPQWQHLYTPIVATAVCFALTVNFSLQMTMLSLSVAWRGTIVLSLALIFVYLYSGLKPKITFYTCMLASLLACIYFKLTNISVPTWVISNTLILSNLVGLALSVLSLSNERVRFLQSIVIEYDKKIFANFNQHLTDLSQQDALTLLRNRRGFEPQLKTLMEQTQQQAQPFALLFIDVDYFKLYNDTYGHNCGDQALIAVAQILVHQISSDDIAMRFGGEEFVVLLTNTSTQQAQQMANQIVQAIRLKNIEHHRSLISKYLTVSIGLTLYYGESTLSYSDILKQADEALYRAKAQGRNQYCMWQSDQAFDQKNVSS